LLDCAGLSNGEALSLCGQDIDCSAGVLTIRRAKYGRARLIPVQTSWLLAIISAVLFFGCQAPKEFSMVD